MNNTFDNTLVEKLRKLLKSNIVCFIYKKVDGTMRVARGTRNLSIASALGYSVPTPKHGEQPYSYYDLDCEGWRSYRPENLISIESVIPMNPTILKVATKGVDIPVKDEPTEEVEIPIYKPKGTGSPLCVPTDFKDLGKIIAGLDKGAPEGDKTTTSIVSPQGEMTSIDQFARLVAKYVVDEIVSRIK